MTKRVRNIVDKCEEALSERDELVEALEEKKVKLDRRANAYQVVIDTLGNIGKPYSTILEPEEVVEVQKLLDKFGGSMDQNKSHSERWNIVL